MGEPDDSPTLHVVIQANGVRRSFRGSGDDALVVAAFRAWLAGPDLELDIARGADDVERSASDVDAAADVVWSGAKEALGEAPGLSAGSSGTAAAQMMAQGERDDGRIRS